MSVSTLSADPGSPRCRPAEPAGYIVLRVWSDPHQGRLISVHSPRCSIGSAAHCTLRLRAAGVGPVECLLARGADRTVIQTQSDRTRLNGRTFRRQLLQAGDWLTVGNVELEVVQIVRVPTAASATTPARLTKPAPALRPPGPGSDTARPDRRTEKREPAQRPRRRRRGVRASTADTDACLRWTQQLVRACRRLDLVQQRLAQSDEAARGVHERARQLDQAQVELERARAELENEKHEWMRQRDVRAATLAAQEHDLHQAQEAWGLEQDQRQNQLCQLQNEIQQREQRLSQLLQEQHDWEIQLQQTRDQLAQLKTEYESWALEVRQQRKQWEAERQKLEADQRQLEKERDEFVRLQADWQREREAVEHELERQVQHHLHASQLGTAEPAAGDQAEAARSPESCPTLKLPASEAPDRFAPLSTAPEDAASVLARYGYRLSDDEPSLAAVQGSEGLPSSEQAAREETDRPPPHDAQQSSHTATGRSGGHVEAPDSPRVADDTPLDDGGVTADEEEESIQAYMAQLLARVGTSVREPSGPAPQTGSLPHWAEAQSDSRRLETATGAAARGTGRTGTFGQPETQNPVPGTMQRPAAAATRFEGQEGNSILPHHGRDPQPGLAEMRQLANETARSAIVRHSHRRLAHSIVTQAMIALAAVLSGAMAAVWSQQYLSWTFSLGMIAWATAILLVIQVTRLARTAWTRRRTRHASARSIGSPDPPSHPPRDTMVP